MDASANVGALGTSRPAAPGGGIHVQRCRRPPVGWAASEMDKDLTSALLAGAVDADVLLLLLLTDVDAVIVGFGTPEARPIRHATPSELRARSFPAGSMAPR